MGNIKIEEKMKLLTNIPNLINRRLEELFLIVILALCVTGFGAAYTSEPTEKSTTELTIEDR